MCDEGLAAFDINFDHEADARRARRHTVTSVPATGPRCHICGSLCIRLWIEESSPVPSPVIDQLAQRYRRSRRTAPSKQAKHIIIKYRWESLTTWFRDGSNVRHWQCRVGSCLELVHLLRLANFIRAVAHISKDAVYMWLSVSSRLLCPKLSNPPASLTIKRSRPADSTYLEYRSLSDSRDCRNSRNGLFLHGLERGVASSSSSAAWLARSVSRASWRRLQSSSAEFYSRPNLLPNTAVCPTA